MAANVHFLRSVGTVIAISVLAGCSGGSPGSDPLSSDSSSSSNGLPWPQGAQTLTQSVAPSGETVSLPAGVGSLSNGATTLGTITFPQSNIPVGAEVVLLAVCCPGPPGAAGPSPPPPSSQAAHRLETPTIDGTYWQMHFISANGPLSGNVTFNDDVVLSYPTSTASGGLVLAIIDVGTVCASANGCQNATPGPPPSMLATCPSSVAAAATDFSCTQLSLDLSQTYELAIETR